MIISNIFWVISGYFGLFCPLLPILLVSNKTYRCITDFMFTFWQLYPTVRNVFEPVKDAVIFT